MISRRFTKQEGFTLLELTLAVAILAVVIGATARTLISFYANLDLQDQRNIAIQHSRAILSDMRSVRDAHPNTADNPTDFQTNVLEQFPNETVMTGPLQLTNSEVEITYESAAPTANPLTPTVTVRWKDLRGRQVSDSISTALTDR